MSKLAAPTNFSLNKSHKTVTDPPKLTTTATTTTKPTNENDNREKENLSLSTSSSSSSTLSAPSLNSSKPRISTGAVSGNVIVAVRIRPLNAMEISTGQHSIWNTTDGYTVQHIQNQHQPQQQKTGLFTSQDTRKTNKVPNYEYDHVFNDRISNKDIYCVIGESMVDKIMDGYHGCIFAYGQTSSGKTHSIFGNTESPGLITNCVTDIFAAINEASDDREYYLRVSYIEVYNEVINDLLNGSSKDGIDLQIREDKKRGVFVENLKEEVCTTAEQALSYIQAGDSRRHIGKTNYNERSSRSHSIFRLVLESGAKGTNSSSKVKQSVLNLVDLAGSENVVKAGSSIRAAETGFINKSLLTLSTVIEKLSHNKVSQHINYRDSKLTRILQNSLSGSSLIVVLGTISPSSGNFDETLSTLRFATTAKKVKHHAMINEVIDDAAQLAVLRQEIQTLKEELEKQKIINQQLVKQPDATSMTPTNTMDDAETNVLQAKIEQLESLILTSSTALPPTMNGKMTLGRHRHTTSTLHTPQNLLLNNTTTTAGTTSNPVLPLNVTASGRFLNGIDLSELMNLSKENDSTRSNTTASSTTTEGEIPNAEKEEELLKLKEHPVNELVSHIYEQEQKVLQYEQQIQLLQAQVSKQDEALKQWQVYYQSNINQQQALQNKIKEILQPLMQIIQKKNGSSKSKIHSRRGSMNGNTNNMNVASGGAGGNNVSSGVLSISQRDNRSNVFGGATESHMKVGGVSSSGDDEDGLLDLTESDAGTIGSSIQELDDLFSQYRVSPKIE